MSEVYIKEPSTKGAAVFRTTHGDLEMEMWATECPKACRNFCQLILEGYYNGTVFHRIIKDFCIQGGDKTGTGDSSESIYGQPYPDEIHPRLKFRYRGMMGVASAGAGTKTNGSQFFIVMDRSPSLDRKHTLFAKVVGQTIYNLVRLNDVEVDKRDRPVDPPRIIRAELTWDPFGDLEPRFTVPAPVTTRPEEKHRREAIKNKRVLSFGGDEEDDDDDDTHPPAQSFGKARSAHDALNDPKLSSEATYKEAPQESKGRAADEAPRKKTAQKAEEIAKVQKGLKVGATPPPAKSRRKVASGGAGADSASAEESNKEDGSDEESSSDEGEGATADKSQKRIDQIQRLKQDIASISRGEPAPKKAKRKSAWEELRAGFKTRAEKRAPQDRKSRQAQAVSIVKQIKSFQGRVRDVAEDDADSKVEERKDPRKDAEDNTFASVWEEGDEESTADWLAGGGLTFHVSADKAFKLDADRARETIEIFDPLAAQDNAEVLAEARKRRAAQLVPSLRRKDPLKTW